MTRSPLTRLLLTGVVLASVGCASTRSGGGTRTVRDDDPLLGGAGMAPPPPPPNSIQPPPSVPALTQATPTSTAALAGGAYRSLPGGNELRIGGELADPPGGAPIQPVAVPRPPALPETIESPSRSAGGQLEQLMAEIGRHHPRWTRLEQVDGKWRFSCSIPDRQVASVSRTITAEGATPVEAVRAGLDRLQRDT